MQTSLTKNMLKMLLIVLIFFGAIFSFKAIKTAIAKHHKQSAPIKPITVSTTRVNYQQWQPELRATGSLRAVKGVDVTTQVGGLVDSIYFTPGASVKQNTLLVKLYLDDEIAQLRVLEATANLAVIVFNRDTKQYAIHAIPQSTLDSDTANLKSTRAQVVEQAAVIAKKMIRAPFSGHLGVSLVNPGQYLNPGDKVTTLQALDPIWGDFYLPEQVLGQLALGQQVNFTTDSFPGKTFTGKITTINPAVDAATRNIQIEATIANPQAQLLPGMFATAQIMTGKPKPILTVPQTAVSFYSYGDVVYVIEQRGKHQQNQPQLYVKQKFVTLGETRGDQIAVLQGLTAGDLVVTSGQLKLHNDSQVVVNNKVAPENNSAPKPTDQ